MRTKPGFNVRNICGENIIVAEGEQNIDFSNIISMNESAAYLWQKLQALDNFTLADMARLLGEEYEVDEQTALADCTALAATWGNAQIIEGDDIPQATIAQTKQESAQPTVGNMPEAQPQPAKRKGFFAKLFKR